MLIGRSIHESVNLLILMFKK